MSHNLVSFIFAYSGAAIAMTLSTIFTEGINNPKYPVSRIIKESILWPFTFANDVYQCITAIKNIKKGNKK